MADDLEKQLFESKDPISVMDFASSIRKQNPNTNKNWSDTKVVQQYVLFNNYNKDPRWGNVKFDTNAPSKAPSAPPKEPVAQPKEAASAPAPSAPPKEPARAQQAAPEATAQAVAPQPTKPLPATRAGRVVEGLKAMPDVIGAMGSKAANTPLLGFLKGPTEKLGQVAQAEQATGTVPGKIAAFKNGFMQGMGEQSIDMSTLKNLELAGASMLGGKYIAGAKSIPKLIKLAELAVSGTFTMNALADLNESAPAAYEAFKSGNMAEAGRRLSKTIGDVVMAGSAIVPRAKAGLKAGAEKVTEKFGRKTSPPPLPPGAQPSAAPVAQPATAAPAPELKPTKPSKPSKPKPAVTPAPAAKPAEKPEAVAAALKQKAVDSHANEPDKLPPGLAGAKPRYSHGPSSYALNFDSDIDKAAYITANTLKKSKEDAKYLKFVMDQTGMTEGQVRAHGAKIREGLKEQAVRAKGAGEKELLVDDTQASSKKALANQKPLTVAKPAAAPRRADLDPLTATPAPAEEPAKAEVVPEPEPLETYKGVGIHSVDDQSGAVGFKVNGRPFKVRDMAAAKRVIDSTADTKPDKPSAAAKPAAPAVKFTKPEVVQPTRSGSSPEESKKLRESVAGTVKARDQWIADTQKRLRAAGVEPMDAEQIGKLPEATARQAARQARKEPGIEMTYKGKEGLAWKMPDGSMKFVEQGTKNVEDITPKAKEPKVKIGSIEVPQSWDKGSGKKPVVQQPPPKEPVAAAKPATPAPVAATEPIKGEVPTGQLLDIKDEKLAESLGLDPDKRHTVGAGVSKGGKITLRDEDGSVSVVDATPAQLKKLFGYEGAKSTAPPKEPGKVQERAAKTVADEKLLIVGRLKSYPSIIRILDGQGKTLNTYTIASDADYEVLNGGALAADIKDLKEAKLIQLEIPGQKLKDTTRIETVEKAVAGESGSAADQAKLRVKKN